MFAIIETGGKQYRVEEGDVIRVEKLSGAEGDKLDLKAIFVGGESAIMGQEAGKYTVSAEVVGNGKHKKIYVRKYKSGIQYRRRTGHRQQFTALKITSIKG